MRKIIFFTILLITIAFFYLSGLFTSSQDKESEDLIENLEVEEYLPENSYIEIENCDYVANFISVKKSENISLYSNLEEKLTTDEIVEKYKCSNLASAGFYGKDDKHLGLFISEYELLSDFKKSALFNGYFSVSNENVYIGNELPKNPRFAIQSGPLLIKKGKPIKLEIRNDEEARRVVAGVTEENEVIFIVIYNKELIFQGPSLNDLPKILSDLTKQLEININDAINLDGGTHSAFFSDEVKIRELSPIGGYFCIKYKQ